MNKKISMFAIIAASLLLLPIATTSVYGHSVARPSDFVVATIWGPETVDPAWCYDTASAELIFNCYDALVTFYVNRSLPPAEQGRTDQFAPALATEWVIAAPPDPTAPAYTNSTYYFKIREGVKFHDGSTLTPQDIEYSIERWMILDRDGGPTWMIYEPLLDCDYSNWSDPEWPQKIDNAVESNSTHVWFNLKAPNFPPMIFMQTIAQSWASIMPNEWAYEHGCWPGEAHPELNPYTNETMTQYYNPDVSPLDDWPTGTGGRVECGSGPYKLDVFNSVEHWYRLVRYPDYWRGWPCSWCNKYGYEGASGYAEGWLETVTIKGIDEWGTRKSMFLAGDADFCYVPRMHLPELVTNWEENPSWDEEEYPPGITCIPGLPTLAEANFFFNLNITVAGNTHIGSPPYDSIHEEGIPYWFFDDVNLRKAFAYCFDFQGFIEEVLLGEAEQPASPLIKGLAYWEYVWDVDEPDLSPPDTVIGPPYHQPAMPNGTVLPPIPLYYQNLTKAEEYFKLAWGGEVWEKGFTFDILYNTGNEVRRTAALVMKEVVEGLNPEKFHINVIEVDWPTYLGELVAKRLTLFIIGWLADYPDPHNFFYPYMHSWGTFSYFQSYSDPEVDELIMKGLRTTEDNERIGIYWTLAKIYHDDAISLPLYQGTGRHWSRDWVEGWYYNPIYPGDYFYHLWKGYLGDVNRDYTVDLFDLVKVARAYGTSPGDSLWDPAADVNGDGTVDIFDLVIVAKQYG